METHEFVETKLECIQFDIDITTSGTFCLYHAKNHRRHVRSYTLKTWHVPASPNMYCS